MVHPTVSALAKFFALIRVCGSGSHQSDGLPGKKSLHLLTTFFTVYFELPQSLFDN